MCIACVAACADKCTFVPCAVDNTVRLASLERESNCNANGGGNSIGQARYKKVHAVAATDNAVAHARKR